MTKKIIIGISGASGVIYGVRLLSVLKEKEVETHLIISESGEKNLQIETDYQLDDVKQMATYVYHPKNMGARVSSGSFLTDGMVVVPCTIKTLSGIANSYSENLIIRAADVTLKEKRKLLLMVRETPLHKGHLDLMARASDHGAQIMPPVPSFYHSPKTIDDIINQTVGKILDYFQIDHHLFQRWGE